MNMAWLLVPDKLVWVFLLIHREVHSHISRFYRAWSKKAGSSSSCPEQNVLLMSAEHGFDAQKLTKLKSCPRRFVNMAMSSLCSEGLHSHQILIQHSSMGRICDPTTPQRLSGIVKPTNLQQRCDAIVSIWIQISDECFQHFYWICATKNQSSSEGKRGSNTASNNLVTS